MIRPFKKLLLVIIYCDYGFLQGYTSEIFRGETMICEICLIWGEGYVVGVGEWGRLKQYWL